MRESQSNAPQTGQNGHFESYPVSDYELPPVPDELPPVPDDLPAPDVMPLGQLATPTRGLEEVQQCEYRLRGRVIARGNEDGTMQVMVRHLSRECMIALLASLLVHAQEQRIADAGVSVQQLIVHLNWCMVHPQASDEYTPF